MEADSPPELTQTQLEKYQLAIALSKEVIEKLGIEDISNYHPDSDFSAFKCNFYRTCLQLF